MKYSLLFLLLGAGFCGLAIFSAGIGMLLWWPGATFLCLAAAYSRQEAWIFGKRHNGQMSVYAMILLMPYLLAYWATWQAQVFFG